MSRATKNFVDGNVGGSFDHSNAIITSANDSFAYFHIVGGANMNSISIWAICWGKHMKLPQPNVLALSYEDVNSFAVSRCKASQHSI